MVMTRVITIDEISPPEVASFEKSADQVLPTLGPAAAQDDPTPECLGLDGGSD